MSIEWWSGGYKGRRGASAVARAKGRSYTPRSQGREIDVLHARTSAAFARHESARRMAARRCAPRSRPAIDDSSDRGCDDGYADTQSHALHVKWHRAATLPPMGSCERWSGRAKPARGLCCDRLRFSALEGGRDVRAGSYRQRKLRLFHPSINGHRAAPFDWCRGRLGTERCGCLHKRSGAGSTSSSAGLVLPQRA